MCVCVFKAPRTYTPVLGALVSPLGTVPSYLPVNSRGDNMCCQSTKPRGSARMRMSDRHMVIHARAVPDYAPVGPDQTESTIACTLRSNLQMRAMFICVWEIIVARR